MMRLLIVATALALLITGCERSLDAQQSDLDRFAKSHKYGTSQDVWLVQHGLAGPTKVALIYGYASDMEFCSEVAEMYMRKYPNGAAYSCAYAN